MKVFLILFIYLFSATISNSNISVVNEVNTSTIITKMFSSIRSIYSLKFTLINSERIKGKILKGEQVVKFVDNPRKIHLTMINPNKGAQVLYIQGENENEAQYYPNSFPYITLNLDPYGSLMRNNNHHTIFQLGFSYILNKLESIYSTQSDYFKYEGNITYNNRPCYKITLEIPDYKYIKYTIKPNETIAAIAKKLNIGEYKILELNTDIEDVYYTKPNRVITIPNYYAKKMELYIDQGNYLPIFQKISDDKGLYEQYEYLNVIVNPKYSSTDFAIKEND